MTKRIFTPGLIILFWICAAKSGMAQNTASGSGNGLHSVPFNQVNIDDAFWNPRLKAHAQTTLQVCISQMRDSTKRISNFEKAAGLKEGKHEGIYFDDSDVYKAMEGIAYSLVNNYNAEYEKLLDYWIVLVAKSQQPDGYLNTYYTLSYPDECWTDMEKHEMYCGGHMIEAAVAHFRATGKKTFLDVAVKFADYIDATFGPGKRHWVTGHEEIELALVKLFNVTQNRKYLDLAHWLLEERGHGHGKGAIWEHPKLGPEYCQDDVPVSKITDIKGHAVRAMYLFTGMADVASEKNVPQYVVALNRVWDDVAERNMYITGGIGSSRTNEGFTEDYDLPNKTAYCETCASIGMVFWNNRMNLLSGDAKYADVLERSLYNGVLAGVSLEGDLFFYVNPLESDGNHHRQRWFGCACCPSNISRFIPSVGNYIYVKGENEIFVNLYMGSETNLEISGTETKLTQKTDYPWNGKISLEVNPSKATTFSLKMRIPGWCKSFKISVNGEIGTTPEVKNGYAVIERKWASGDVVELALDMPVELIAANPRVTENSGKRAVRRGPLVYCMEETDNKNIGFDDAILDQNTVFLPEEGKGKLKGMTLLNAVSEQNKFTLVPYFSWANRKPGKMKTWIDYETGNPLYINKP
jgi:DUF1680 family protein